MIDALRLCLALILPVFCGQALLRAGGIRFRRDRSAFCAWAFAAGALVTALLLFGAMSVGLDARGPWPAVLVLLLGLAAEWRARRRRPETVETAAPMRPLAMTATGLALLLVLAAPTFSALGSWRKPIYKDDDASIWTMKARVLHDHGRIDDALKPLIDEKVSGGHHADYPLLGPLLQVWTMSLAGRPLDGDLRLMSMAWLLALGLLAFSAYRRALGPIPGSLLALLLVGAPALAFQSTGTKCDHVVAFALLAILDLLDRSRSDPPDGPYLALAGLMAAILVWAKNEGLMLLAALALAALLLRVLARITRSPGRPLRLRGASAWLLPLLVLGLQSQFNRRFDLSNDLLTGGAGRDERSLPRMVLENFPVRLRPIATAFWTVFSDPEEIVLRGRSQPLLSNRGLFIPFFLVLLAFPLRLLRGRAALAAWTGLIALSGYFMVYVITFEDLEWHLVTSSPRVLLQVLPSLLLAAAFVAAEVKLCFNRTVDRPPAI